MTIDAPNEYLTGIKTAPAASDTAFREVARVIFPADRDHDALPLYIDGRLTSLVDTGPEGQRAVPAASEEAGASRVLSRRSVLIASGTVSFGSYFNAFPASYWRRWTSVESVVLRVATSGEGVVSVFRSNARGIPQRVDSRTVSGPTTSEFELTLAPFGDGGWYWFDVSAGTEPITLEEAGWLVPSGGRQPGRLTLGITTFNRTDYCVNTIRTIAEASDLDAILDELIVVDQGTKLVSDEEDFPAAKEAMRGRLRMIRQANMGGSGGFSRSMFEVAQGRADGRRSDYLLILDDDIILEPESLCRAAAFADFCLQPTIVGGHMFDLYDRTQLLAFAEVVNPYRFLWGPIEGLGQVDFGEAGLRSRKNLHKRWDGDYNGWWMCLIPRTIIEEVGLSLPVFIKWDDSEYSLRARERGYPTVSLPGAAIWHVSWTDKNDAVDWQAYFHERNRLIAALLHSPYARGGRIVRESLNTHTKHVVSMQYYAGEAVLRALEDVLAGPGQLHEWLPTKTAEIRSMKDDFTDAQISKRVADFPSPRRAKPPKRQDVRMPSSARVVPWAFKTVAKQVGMKPRELSRRHPEAVVSNQDAHWWYLASLDSAVVSNAEGTGASFYQRDPEQMRKQLARSARLHQELLTKWSALSRTYRSALDEITSPDAWGETFRRNGVDDR